ncbi:SCO family protein [Alcaligenaceae bacterium]|nr:SCO family protein [Alcaligenaceae bacterium]
MKMLIAVLLACLMGIGALYAQTDGFSVLTTEAARRADVRRHPRPVPNAALAFADGNHTDLAQALRDDGRMTVINFMYTRCFSICLAMGSELQQLQDEIQTLGLDKRVRILSLSFDPADTPDYLARYQASQRANPQIWSFATLTDAAQRQAVLKAFGIIVVPAAMGQFEHNAAYHVVTPEGKLVQIVDIGTTDTLLTWIERYFKKRNP